jgi:hypothetical protein
VEIVAFGPVTPRRMETRLAGAFSTVLGNSMGFTYDGPSRSASVSKAAMLPMLP